MGTALQPSPLRVYAKPALWATFALMALSVLIFYDLPILKPAHEAHGRMVAHLPILIPHALAAGTALLLGPLQFSSRFRKRYTPLHRLLGKVYIGCVFAAAPLAVLLGWHAPGSLPFVGTVQAGVWVILTLAAFLTARNRQIAEHRKWMIRSYAVGCSLFVLNRVTDPIAFFHNLSPDQFSVMLLFFMVLALLIPSIIDGWDAIVPRRQMSLGNP
jgi:uncharacterized membrane protein